MSAAASRARLAALTKGSTHQPISHEPVAPASFKPDDLDAVLPPYQRKSMT